MDNQGFISVEFLFSVFIILIIATGLLVYANTSMNSSLNIESNFNHRLILDSVANSINRVDSHGGGYSIYMEMPESDEPYVVTLNANRLTIEYDDKKGEALLPFVDSYNSYKMYSGRIYVVEKTDEGKILIK